MHFAKKPHLHPLLLSLLFLAMIGGGLMLTENPISHDDGLRHYTIASVMREKGILAVPGWSKFFYEGWLADHPVDPWFLSDVLYVPFTYLPIAPALKLFSIVALGLLAAAFLFVLSRMRLGPGTQGILLALLFFGDQQFLYRSLIGRPFPLMTAVFLLCLFAVLERRFVFLTVLLTLSVLLSHLFVFPVLLSLLGIVWLALLGKRTEALLCFAAIILGLLLGFLLHPAPGEYLVYLWEIFLRIPFFKSLHLGRELARGGIAVDSLMPIFVAGSIAALLIPSVLKNPNQWRALRREGVDFLLVLTIGLLCAFAFWMRTIDLLWPLLLIVLGKLLSLDPKAPVRSMRLFLPSVPRRAHVAALLLLLLALNAGTTQLTILRRDPHLGLTAFRGMEAIPAGSRVLNVEWDRFPALVTVRPDLRYATGMDPTFTYVDSPRVSELLGQLRDNDVDDERAWLRELLSLYPADVVVLTRSRAKAFIEGLKEDASVRIRSETGALLIVDAP